MSMIKPFSYSMAAVLLSSTSALAATCFDGSTSCATVSGKTSDCLALGYSKDDVVGCKHYLLCPFDTSYKACVTQKFMDCSAYPLTKCPDNGFCSECNDGSTTKYKLDRCDNCFSQISVNGGMCSRNYQYDKCPTDAGAATCSECTYSGKTVYNILTCKPGYTLNGVFSNSRTCVANKCDGYTLTQCPANGICSSCQAGSTIKYKFDSCKEGYYKSGNSCLPNTCSGFTLSTCPTNGICSECMSGSTTKYKLDSCKEGYKLSGNTCVKIADCDTLSECQSKIPQDGTTIWDYYDLKGNYSRDTKAGDATQICRYQTIDGSTCYKPEQINCADIDSLYGVYSKLAYMLRFDTIDECEDFIRPYNEETGNNIKCQNSSLWNIGGGSNYILVSDGSVETCQTFIEWYNDNFVAEADKNGMHLLTCYSIEYALGLGAHSLEATYKNSSGTTVKQVDLACAFPLSVDEFKYLTKPETELPSAPEPEFNCNDMNGLDTQEYCYSLGYTTYVPQDGSPCDPCPCSDMYCKDPRL